jgi:hypothetical protein
MNEEIVYKKLEVLTDEINTSNANYNINLDRQTRNTKRISLTGANGRLGVYPSTIGYDISLSGKSIEEEMYPFMRDLCGRECDGYIQKNTKLGKKNQPFWRVSEFSLVKNAAYYYSTTVE